MAATHSTRFFWSDWLGDMAVRQLTPAERGLWIDCLAIMATANPVGHLCDQRGEPITRACLARIANCTADEVKEMLSTIVDKGVASRDLDGLIYSRRMLRDVARFSKNALAGKKGGKTTWLKIQQKQGFDLATDLATDLAKLDARLKEREIPSSFPTAAREEEKSQQRPAGPATALPTGAPSRPASAEPAEAKAGIRAAPIRPFTESLEEVVRRKGWANG
jgi:hypothetical protein